MQQDLDTDDLVHGFEMLLQQRAVKLELSGSTRTWRLMPSLRHQRVIDRIRASLQPDPASDHGCGCFHFSDIGLRLPDGSFKRPDIAIFCDDPPDTDQALELLPVAVIEIVSPNYEAKDLSINPPLYLANGVGEVLIVEPREAWAQHFHADGRSTTYQLPQRLVLDCGCLVQL